MAPRWFIPGISAQDAACVTERVRRFVLRLNCKGLSGLDGFARGWTQFSCLVLANIVLLISVVVTIAVVLTPAGS